jgi:hypothetical protein
MRITGSHINADPETMEKFIRFSSDHKSKDNKKCSVADPGSGAFMPPGFAMDKKVRKTWIIFLLSLETIFWG